MNIDVRSGLVSVELEAVPTPQQLADIIKGCAEYWPHSAKVSNWHMHHHADGTIGLTLEWKIE